MDVYTRRPPGLKDKLVCCFKLTAVAPRCGQTSISEKGAAGIRSGEVMVDQGPES